MSETTQNELKQSKNPVIQGRVNENKEKLTQSFPNTPEDIINRYARDKVAAQINRGRLRKEKEESDKKSSIDPLTGLLSRAEYERRQEEERARAVRNNYPMVIASLDLNNLKEINDNSGHAKGDEYLKRTGEIIKKSIRLEDVAGRVGGDEFMVLFVETDRDGANVWLERIRKEFKAKGIDISIGLSAVDLRANIMRSIEIADARMYQNKREQKNGNHKPSAIKKITTKLRQLFRK